MKKISIAIEGREQLDMTCDKEGRVLNLRARGDLNFLRKVDELRASLAQISDLDRLNFAGTETVDFMLRELKARLGDNWGLPYQEEELCHCRAVPTQKVIDSIYTGSNTCPKVGEACSAGTSCGNCQADIKNLLDYL